MKYEQSLEYQVPVDKYEQISVPESEYQRLPEGY